MNQAPELEMRSPQSEPVPVVETQNLGKFYRTGFWMNQKIESLRSCTLTLYRGETFGLLGQNGAGKTTLFKLLLGLVRPTSGRASLLGKPIGDRPVKQRVGYLPENPYFYDHLTGWEFLEFAAELFQIPRGVSRRRIPELLDLVGLAKSAAVKKQMRQYSKGMLQRIGMAQALINDPELVFLDEPMSGLDPMGRYQIREIILSLKDQGKTIFFNSHVLSDVEKICDRVGILVRGELICAGSLDELLGTAATYAVTGKGGDRETLENWLENFDRERDSWQGHLTGDPQAFLEHLQADGGQLISMNLSRLTLEEFFMRQLRDRGITSSS
ncbi:ABC transporter ATP-binding protein [Lyngbya sp. CCY1209]|uniref:ABC transporter ATP-binding protein n=1 Tax=Lyngbya sp. CCY1209 TaxID=2886103 RepID=UPI002D208460|nr:ABC transporter ATP-binding protein [Lyngbya sp. CCY1209]MEB3884534.1 ABC transporter ATP-binding protein [Lyngbya sp. CCY1209]